MFFKKDPRQTPAVKVKKASDIISGSSHKQKKYLSIMLVPSYTTGKTRSLRIPRAVFYCVIISLFAVSAIIAGLQIRANYLRHVAEHYSNELALTAEELLTFQFESEYEMNNILAANADVVSQLTDEQLDRWREENRLRREYQASLDEIQYQLDALERWIHEFDEELTAAIAGLTDRTFIPPVAAILDRLNASQAAIREAGMFPGYENGYANGYTNGLARGVALNDEEGDENEGEAGIVLLSALTLPAPVSRDDLTAQIEMHKNTLELMAELKQDLQYFRTQLDPHLLNHPTMWPVRAGISSPFGWRPNPFGGANQFHTGIDIPARHGTPIRATGGGTVTFSGWGSGGWGYKIIIDHGHGIRTLYAHNSVNLVTVGQRVERGETIARVGSTGQTTGPHVHYEVHVNGTPVNPTAFLLE